jgi:hypothetical protein
VREGAPRTRITRVGNPTWDAFERELLTAGMPLPLPSRRAWFRHHGGDARFVTVHQDDDAVLAGLAVQIGPTRALIGHRLMRVAHGGTALSGPRGDTLIKALRGLADTEPRILRLNVEAVLRTPNERTTVAARMLAAGFRAVQQIRHYRDTLIVDLDGSEEDIFSSFSATTRRELRRWAERPVEMRLITDARYAARLNDLARETFARTGGDWQPRPWEARIALCREVPEASRLVGLFRTGRDDDESLLAYAWGCAHGDHVHYDDAGSTRVEDFKVSLMYPLMWDLIRWAKAQGCAWFDLGGAVPAEATSDPRLGISDFKRRFSKQLVTVGAEWEYAPHPRRAAFARLLSETAVRFRRMR